MNLDMVKVMTELAMATITSTRSAEQVTRDAISNTGIEATVRDLFPGVADDFIKSNRNFPNVLQRGVNRYVSAVTRAELNWEWTGTGNPPEDRTPAGLLNRPGRALLQAATVDALATGKFAYFPYRDDAGRVQISALSGFLWPIFQAGNSTVIEAVLQITSQTVDGKVRYEVRRYSPGLLEVFSDLEDWKKYATAPVKPYPQAHAPDRLPLAFRITGLDANRLPEGIAGTAMPAFLDYVKARVLLSFARELGAFEERVYTSDEVFKLAKETPAHPLLKALQLVGPRKAKFLPSGDKYERLEPIDLTGFAEQAREAADAVDSAMSIPPKTGAAELAGIALAEIREAYTEQATSLCSVAADALTEAVELAALLDSVTVQPGWRITLAPRFTQDTQTERLNIREDFKADLLPRSAALSGLQGIGVSYVTDAMVAEAEAVEEAERGVTAPGGT